jgi:hypothetical protein
MQLTAAIIGAGLMGKWHAHSIRKAGVKISSIVEENSEAGLRLASKYNAQYLQDAGKLFEQKNCDVVHICTPLGTHFELASQALESGSHALVEKPLAPTEAETAQLAQRASECGKLICPVLQFPFQDGVAKLRSNLQNRNSAPLSVEFDIASAGGSNFPQSALNSLILEILPHPLSVLYALWPYHGDIRPDWNVTWPQEGELLALGNHAGIPILIRISLHARPTRCEMTVRHREGELRQDFFHGYSMIESGQVSRLNKIAGPFSHSGNMASAAAANLFRRALRRQWAYPGLDTLVRNFYTSIDNGSLSSPIKSKDYIAIARTCAEFSCQLPVPDR